MEEEVTKNQVDSTTTASSNGEPKKTDTVSYDSFRKSVEAEKRARERAQNLEAQLEAKNNQELEAQGKHEEIIANLKQKLSTTQNELAEVKTSATWDKVTGAIKTEALKAGCVDPDKLIRLYGDDEFSILQSEDGRLRQESVQALVEKSKKDNWFLFPEREVKINDGVPSKKPIVNKNLEDLSLEELRNLLP